ncbi:hypothetical protein KAS24_01700, partial [Candidatus Bathyarchaeota archaeon]|nr:hypothetical protein [Candidatus Bathyarchaeota archaeon]
FNVDEFLQTHGYQNEEEFMNSFQGMIENAQGAEDIEDAIQNLQEIGHTIRNINEDLTQEVGRHRGHNGQEETGSGNGFGNMGSGGSP